MAKPFLFGTLGVAAVLWGAACTAELGSVDRSPDRTNSPNGSNPNNSSSPSADDAPIPPPPPGSIPLFVAQGHVGRTIVSCDEGRSWVADRSDNDALTCFSGVDCDHHAGSAQGITYGDGWFFATYGWGTPGGVRRSRDGVSWETPLSGSSFSGLAFGNDRLVSGDHTPTHSDDVGDTWFDGGDSGIEDWNTRRIGFVAAQGGRFILVGDGPEILVSSDGVSWSHPTTIPSDCGDGVQTDGGIAYGNGVAVVAGSNGIACRTADGGDTWTSTRFADSADSELLWSGSEFMIWGRGVVYRSLDGASWTSTDTVPTDLGIGAVASNGAGTIVAVNGQWGQWYDDQVFYRSTDGVSWQALSEGDFVGSHPIRHIAFGYGSPSVACPAP